MDVTIPALAIVRDLGLAYEQAAQGQSQPDGQNDGQRAKQPAPWLVAPDEQSLWRSGQIGDGDGDEGMQLFVNEKSRNTRDTRDTRDTIDTIDSREYVKLDEKINKIQNYIESMKQTQDKILELLEGKVL